MLIISNHTQMRLNTIPFAISLQDRERGEREREREREREIIHSILIIVGEK
jgi:hypothetical protein